MRRIAHLFSGIFHPLLMTIFASVIYLLLPFYAFTLLPSQVFWYVLICNALFTVLLPVLMILLMQRYDMITSVQLNRREERAYPIIFTILFHGANYYFLSRAQLPGPYMFFLLAGIFSLLIVLIITYYWKISLHTTGIGGVCGAFLSLAVIWPVDLRFLIAGLFLASGLTASSRLYLNAHTSGQTTAGFLVGFMPQLAVIWLAS